MEDILQQIKFDNSCFTFDENRKILNLLKKFAKMFKRKLTKPGQAISVAHEIDTGNFKPISSAPYRAGPKEREKIEEITNEMLTYGVAKFSRSPWSSPIVLIKKKDGSIRFCVDYRKLNNLTKRDVYPLPRTDDSLNALGGSKYFSSFDMTSGYWQIRTHEDSREKTAFISH
jgi:hypothetical protein